MSGSLQREWLIDILESTPSVFFLVLLRSSIDIELAGWIGAALAALVLIGFRLWRMNFNPILLGINVHLLVITPLFVTVFRLGAPEIGDTLVAHAHQGVLITVSFVGLALTLLSQDGFIGYQGLSVASVRTYSALLWAASLVAIVWSFAYAGETILGVAVPIIALFGLRRLLIARLLDSNTVSAIIAAGGGAAFTYGSESDAG